jgi:class 3 adenylate cyclase
MALYRRTWDFAAPPDQIWEFIANTHQINYYANSPAVVDALPEGARLPNANRLLRAVVTVFLEKPFDWVKPVHFKTTRQFKRFRIFDVLTSDVRLEALPGGGTRVHYEMTGSAAYFFMHPFVPLLLRRILNAFERPLRAYDTILQTAAPRPELALPPQRVRFAPNGRARLASLATAFARDLAAYGLPPQLSATLTDFLATSDDLNLHRIRPYALAAHWDIPRQTALELCLLATRAGLLELRWELLCPNCRGQRDAAANLTDLEKQAHCDTCNITFDTHFSESVELVFRASPATRVTEGSDFCVHGPELTPHIYVQQLLAPGERRTLQTPLPPGFYRARALELPGSQPVEIGAGGAADGAFTIQPGGWQPEVVRVAPQPHLTIHNATATEQLFVLERTAWRDDAATGAQVIAMQAFRDLFAAEALRPDRQIAVGEQTIIFTDIRASTRLYRDLGDAVAFACVLDHFELLKTIIREEQGGIVKTIGDAVMGVFQEPVSAVRAVVRASRALRAQPEPLGLKAGIHTGPCIAVALNNRLDYFGTTVNLASRLQEHSGEAGFIVSETVRADPAVRAYLAAEGIAAAPVSAEIRDFGGEPLQVWRILA